MIGAPIRNAYLDDASVIAEARRAAWAIFNDKPHPGFRKLGSGHFSRVYSIASHPGLVLKVGGPGTYGRGESRYSAHGVADVWPHYVEHTASMSPLPEWAPHVYHVESLAPGFYFAVMERLGERRCGRYVPPPGVPGALGSYVSGDDIPASYYDMLDAEGERRGFGNDMHGGNFLVRVRGEHRTVVITDPWYAGG